MATQQKYIQRNTEIGQWHHIYAPTKGLVTSISSTRLPKEASPYMKGVYLKNGEVRSDYGYTAFPVAGVIKTNALHGIPLKFNQFTKWDGTSHLVALTTTNAYDYNTTTNTWDCVTKGTLVEDCEDAWNEQAIANVTTTAVTTPKLRGTNSVKVAIGADFTTGVAADEVVGDLNLTGATALHFWIYSSIALTAGQLQVGVSESALMGGTPLWFNVPVIVANTWTPCCVDGDFTGYDHVISVGLKVITDVGAAGADVYIDDVRAVTRFTGDADNLFSSTTMLNTYIITNGKDQPQQYDGTASTGFTSLTTTLGAGSITTSEVVFSFKDHICFCNNTENGADRPLRVTWGNVGSLSDYVNGTAGYQDLLDDESHIMAVKQIGENDYVIYKERSVVVMTWVGGHTPFRFKTMVDATGVVGKDAVTNVAGIHYCFGQDSIFTYNGGADVKYIPDLNRQYLYDLIDRTYIGKSTILYIEEDSEIQVWIPSSTAYLDTVFSIDRDLGVWYRRDKAMTAYGFWSDVSTKTIGDLIGTIGEQNWTFGDSITKSNYPITIIGTSDSYVWKRDKTTQNNGSSAITSEWQTPDFTFPDDTQYANKYIRVPQLIYEAKGQIITTEWSEDGGTTWNPTGSGSTNIQTLTSNWEIYQQDFDVVCRKVRFRFIKSTASQGYNLRYYGVYWMPRSGRS